MSNSDDISGHSSENYRIDMSDDNLSNVDLQRKKDKPKRAPKFTTIENEALIEGVVANYKSLFGKNPGLNLSFEKRENIWRKISKSVSAVAKVPRSANVCKKRYSDCKITVKKKMSMLKNEQKKTGGGSPQRIEFFDWEKSLSKKIIPSSVHGIPEGIDTEKLSNTGECYQKKKLKKLDLNKDISDSSKNCLPSTSSKDKRSESMTKVKKTKRRINIIQDDDSDVSIPESLKDIDKKISKRKITNAPKVQLLNEIPEEINDSSSISEVTIVEDFTPYHPTKAQKNNPPDTVDIAEIINTALDANRHHVFSENDRIIAVIQDLKEDLRRFEERYFEAQKHLEESFKHISVNICEIKDCQNKLVQYKNQKLQIMMHNLNAEKETNIESPTLSSERETGHEEYNVEDDSEIAVNTIRPKRVFKRPKRFQDPEL